MPQSSEENLRFTADLDDLRREFEAQHVTKIPALFSGAALERLLRRIDSKPWEENIFPGLKVELVQPDVIVYHLLHFLTNAPDFLASIRAITGFESITNFRGRIYRMYPGQHVDSWHNDMVEGEGRLVGMSVNLSPAYYEGGNFELRERESGRVIGEFPNKGLGGAILFRISPALQHKVSVLAGHEPKTAIAGWFKSEGDNYVDSIRGAAVDKITSLPGTSSPP